MVLAHFVTNRKKHKKNQNQKQKFTFLYQRRHEKVQRYKNRHKKIFSLFYMVKYYQNQAKNAIQDIKNATVSTGNFLDVKKMHH